MYVSKICIKYIDSEISTCIKIVSLLQLKNFGDLKTFACKNK